MDAINILNTNLADFEKSLKIVETDSSQKVKFGGSSKDGGGYYFNQKETIDLIDLYYNSKYKDGKEDQDAQRKLFMNIVRFYANVAEKQTDMDVSNYSFIPDSEEFADMVWFLKRQFTVWTRENYYGETLNELNKDYSKYGTCVLRQTKDGVERIPLQKLKCSQDAESLRQAPEDGGYVIIEHDLTLQQMKKMPDWNTEDIDFEGTTKVYEQYYMYHPADLGKGGDEPILGVAYIAPDVDKESPILFAEQVNKVPLEEAHWDKQDGRWLGIGEVEKQFENQVAINMTENLRRKHLIWGAKKVWQTQGTAVVNNLVKQVSDGQVLEVGANGAISEVPMATQNLAEFQASKDAWMTNSEKQAFAFEVSTGESMPSGTPFRLGVILANSAARYYELKRENFGLFLKRSFYEQLIPIFKKQSKEHKVAVANGEEGAEFIRNAIINWNINRKYNAKMLNGDLPVMEEVMAEVERDISSKPFLFVKVPKDAYKDVKFYMNLDLTGEDMDAQTEMSTLTTLFEILSQKGDPRADEILKKIVLLTGNNPNKLLGTAAGEAVAQGQAQPQGAPQLPQGGGSTPDLTALNESPENALA